jgi:hypothetical protein
VKRILIAAALVAIMASAAYAAPPPGKGKPENPGQSNAHKAGENGSPNSANNVNNANANNPAKACKKERTDLGVDAFATKYGTNHNLKNAFGKCVSGKAKAKASAEAQAQDEQSTSNAAKQCKKERSDMGVEAFKSKYGTNANKANSFGKCVSSKSKGSGESDDD